MGGAAGTQTIRVGRHDIPYAVQGVGPPVLCFELPLNGMARFTPLQAALESSFRTYIIDLRRVIGDSDRRPPAEDLLDFLSTLSLECADALGVQTCSVMGSFMAGPLVVDMALKAPGRIRSMILLGPLGTLASPATALLRLITGFYRLPGIPRLIRVPFVRSSAEWCDRRILGPRRMREIFYEAASAPVAFEDLYEMHKRPPNTHAHVALMWCIRNMKYARVIARLSEIGCPSLIIHGEQDDWIPVRYAELLHRSIARSSLVVVPRTRHAPELERVDIVSNEIRMFLSAAGSGRQTAGDFGSPASQAGTQP